uniref:3-hydroxyisobutyryl-CoA hydrolase, mitochondrial n=1 Tax=Elaeophora elaphi TaxID=1147741 RepID=A0A0R3RIH6_9BILA
MVFRSLFQRRFWLDKSKRLLSTGADEEILAENINGKLVVTLNRPKALNALNISMVRKLYSMLKKCNSDRSLPFILVKGAGGKAFCAGGDIVAVSRSVQANDPSDTIYKDFFREEYVLNHLIGVLRVPYIAVMDGITMGGGCGLSLHGKYRIATERTILAMPETAIGLFPDVGGTFFLSRLPYNLGHFMALTGYRVEGADVYHMGLATHFVSLGSISIVPSAKLKDLEDELIRTDNKFLSVGRVDQILNKYHMKESEIPKFGLEKRLAQIDYLFSGSTVESLFKKLRSDDDFGKKQCDILSTKSPTSLKVTFRQLQIGLKMQFREVFTMEYRLSQRFMKNHDFHEGCRAILIDKDQKPEWKPANIEEVTDEMMDEYFAPLQENEELIIKELEN